MNHLPMALVDVMLKDLAKRDDFNDWWDSLDVRVQLEIVASLEKAVGTVVARL